MTSIGCVRKLKKEEHILTRPLWERIFKEDSKEFLDYYYTYKTRYNEIYVIEDQNEIIAMLHLNPYQMRIGQEVFDTHYIVAVATDESYRRQGLMARLMNEVLAIMKMRGEPFTFLMPAKEAYYLSFGFESILHKKESFIEKSIVANEELSFSFATEEDIDEMVHFANEFLSKYDVATLRTRAYYVTLLAEHTCEAGGILLMRKEGKIIGLVPFFGTEAREIKQPMLPDDEQLKQAALHLLKSEEYTLKMTEYPFMVKVLDEVV